jgi:putative flippase GtrA
VSRSDPEPARSAPEADGLAPKEARLRTRRLAALAARRGLELRFVAVGVWNTVFGYGAFCILDSLLAPVFRVRYLAYTSAQVLSQVLAVLNAYACHKVLTFRSSVRGRAALWELAKFSSVYAVTLCFGLVGMPLLVELVGLPPKLAILVLMAVCTLASYWGHKNVSFRSPADSARPISARRPCSSRPS